MATVMKGRRKVKPYVRLMQTARLHLGYAENDEVGSFLNSLSCLLLSALMIEGFMNHAGAEHVPTWPTRDEERKRRIGPKWKFDKLLKHTDLSPDLAVRPFSSFEELFEFRNTIGHARTEVISYSGPVLPDHKLWGDHPQLEWEKLCTPAAARERFEDAREICEEIWRGLGQESALFFSGGYMILGVDMSAEGG